MTYSVISQVFSSVGNLVFISNFYSIKILFLNLEIWADIFKIKKLADDDIQDGILAKFFKQVKFTFFHLINWKINLRSELLFRVSLIMHAWSRYQMWTLLNLSCKCLIPQLKLFVEGMTPFEYRRLNSNQSVVRHEIEINYLTPLILNKKRSDFWVNIFRKK